MKYNCNHDTHQKCLSMSIATTSVQDHVQSASPQATTTQDTADLGVSKGHVIFRYLFQFVAVLSVQIYIVFEAYYSQKLLTDNDFMFRDNTLCDLRRCPTLGCYTGAAGVISYLSCQKFEEESGKIIQKGTASMCDVSGFKTSRNVAKTEF